MLIDWFTVAAQVINFLILVWLLKRFLYRPILAALDQREKNIASQLQDAEQKKAEAQKEQIDFQHKNEDFERQKSELFLTATTAAKAEREKLFQTARDDSETLRSKLQKAVGDEFSRLNQKLGLLAQREVFSISRKVLMDLAGLSVEERIIAVFIQRLHDLDDAQRTALKSLKQSVPQAALVRTAFDLASAQRKSIQDAVIPLLPEGTAIDFEVKSDLISGIEFSANGQTISWSVDDYLSSLTTSASALLAPQAVSDPIALPAVLHAA